MRVFGLSLEGRQEWDLFIANRLGIREDARLRRGGARPRSSAAISDAHDRSIDRSINQSIDQSINRSIDQSINRSIDRSIDQSILSGHMTKDRARLATSTGVERPLSVATLVALRGNGGAVVPQPPHSARYFSGVRHAG